jgi:hypothetical protein
MTPSLYAMKRVLIAQALMLSVFTATGMVFVSLATTGKLLPERSKCQHSHQL